MAESWLIKVFEQNHDVVYSGESAAGPIELGRQGFAGESVYATSPSNGQSQRIVIAGPNEDRVSRRHAYVEPLADGRIRVANRSQKAPIGLPNNRVLSPGDTCELLLPVVITLGNKTVRIQKATGEEFGESLQG